MVTPRSACLMPQLAGHNDSSKGEGPAHVDGAVVEGHGQWSCSWGTAQVLG